MSEWLKSLGLNAEMGALVTQYAVRIGSVLLIILLALIIGNMVRNWVERGLKRVNFDATLTKFIATVSRWIVLIVAFLGCLEMFGIKTTSFAAIIGGASLAVGLAFQGTLSNIAAGVMLLIFRPFKVGDVITVAGQTGGVEEIGLFTTSLNTPNNVHIILPNGKIFGDTITNITRNEHRRIDINVGVDYDADIDETRKVLEKAARSVKTSVTSEEPMAFLVGLGGSSVDWQVRVFSNNDDYWDVYQAAIKATKEHLDAAGIGIPYPTQSVIHENSPE